MDISVQGFGAAPTQWPCMWKPSHAFLLSSNAKPTVAKSGLTALRLVWWKSGRFRAVRTVTFLRSAWRQNCASSVVTPPCVNSNKIRRNFGNFLQSTWTTQPTPLMLTAVIAAGSSNVWQVPDPVDTVVCAPDDGWRYHPKHVEQFHDINKLCSVASRWKYILEYIYNARTPGR
jgi:hypothetical protein